MRKTQEQRRLEQAQLDRERDLAMMQSPNDWPNWPVLPIKKWDKEKHQMDCACIIDEGPLRQSVGIKVYLVSMYQLCEKSKPLMEHKSKEYPSLDALVADGWKVD